MTDILTEPHVDGIVMPENLKVGLMVKEQRNLCKNVGCDFDYYGLAFGQSPFHLPSPLQNALSENAPMMVASIEALKGWVDFIKQT